MSHARWRLCPRELLKFHDDSFLIQNYKANFYSNQKWTSRSPLYLQSGGSTSRFSWLLRVNEFHHERREEMCRSVLSVVGDAGCSFRFHVRLKRGLKVLYYYNSFSRALAHFRFTILTCAPRFGIPRKSRVNHAESEFSTIPKWITSALKNSLEVNLARESRVNHA